jgi:hypothetical protein
MLIRNILQSDDPNYFSAEMTKRQFSALALKLDKQSILAELKELSFFKSINMSSSYEQAGIAQLVKNGHNTEKILRINNDLLTNEQAVYALQWAFPQAYYSVYALLMAFFKTVGHPENTHTSCIRKFGKLVHENKYPKTISFLSTGGIRNISFIGIECRDSYSTLEFNANDNRTILNQICQFLRSTRQLELQKSKDDRNDFKTKKGKPRKNLSASDWEKVSIKLGYTSILNLLYRKRIKSNYRDIETFLAPNIEPAQIISSLIHIVSCLNFIHETYIAKAIGFKGYKSITTHVDKYVFVKQRTERIQELLTSI